MPVTLYRADLNLLSAEACFPFLINEERMQASGVTCRATRDEFVKSRALLRAVLSKHTGCPPHAIELATGPFGKPMLAKARGLHFNVTHSDGMALVAISSAAVGVDIERMNFALDHGAIAAEVFSSSEIEMLDNASHGQTEEVFFALWTRKEAYLKATGRGFSSDLPSISTHVRGAPVADASCPTEHLNWYASDVPAPQGFKAALVTTTPAPQVTLVDVLGFEGLGVAESALAEREGDGAKRVRRSGTK